MRWAESYSAVRRGQRKTMLRATTRQNRKRAEKQTAKRRAESYPAVRRSQRKTALRATARQKWK